MDAVERAREFMLALARESAGEVMEAPWGIAVRHAAYPISYTHNQLWVCRPVPVWVLLDEAERLLEGLGHRQLTVLDDATGRALAPEMSAAGYVHGQEVLMVAEVPPPPPAPGVAEQIPFRDLRAPMAANWRREIPGLSDDGVRQLVARTQETARACRLSLFGVRDGDAVAAWCELYQRDGIAQIEDVITLPDWRGRGFATAMVLTAARAARDEGAGLVFLVADENDWPRHFYRRLGFRERARVHVFARSTA